MVAACATACIIARANAGLLDIVQGQKLAQQFTRDTQFLCNNQAYRWWLLDHGLRDPFAIGIEIRWQDMYARGMYGVPCNGSFR